MATPHVQADEPSLLERRYDLEAALLLQRLDNSNSRRGSFSDSSGITSPEAPAAIDAFPAGKAANQVPILLSGEQPGIPP